MASFNKAILLGNLTKDPELKFIPNGTAVCNMTVACNRSWKDKDGKKKEDCAFIKCVVWGKMAEATGEHMKKGSPVLVEGHIQTRTWDKEDGTKGYATEVVAERVQFLPRGQKAEHQDQGTPAAEPGPEEEAGGRMDDDIPF